VRKKLSGGGGLGRETEVLAEDGTFFFGEVEEDAFVFGFEVGDAGFEEAERDGEFVVGSAEFAPEGDPGVEAGGVEISFGELR
jgi:hypothetical protein